MVGEGHGGHAQPLLGQGLDGGMEAAGTADDEGQPRLLPGQQTGQLLAGAELPLHAQGRHGGAGGQPGADGLRLPGQGPLDLRRGGVLRQTLLRQLHQIQLAAAAQALAVLRRRLDVEPLLQLPHTDHAHPLHGAPSREIHSPAVFQGAAGPRQGGLRRAQGEGRGVVLPAQVGQQHRAGPGPGAGGGVAGGVGVAQVAAGAQHPLLEGVGVGTGEEHVHVVVALQHQQLRPQQGPAGLLGDIPRVREVAHPAVGQGQVQGGALAAVVAGGQQGQRRRPRLHSLAQGDRTQQILHTRQPVGQLAARPRRAEDGGAVLLYVGGQPADVVAVLVGDHHPRQLLGPHPRLGQPLADPAAGDAHIDEQAGLPVGEEGGVAAGAAGKGLKCGHRRLPGR